MLRSNPAPTAMGKYKNPTKTNNNNRFCPYCLITCGGNVKCGKCGQEMITISYRCRVPKKDAPKEEWEALFESNPHILARAPYTKALAKMGFKTKEDNT